MDYTRREFAALALGVLASLTMAGCRTESIKPSSPQTLRVLTYNIHHGEGTDKQFDYQRLAGVIKGLKPDIVALQEVDHGTERASGVDQAKLLAKLCRMHYAFGQAMPHQGGQYGEAVLSRFPIEKTFVHPLPYQLDREPRSAIEVVIAPPGIGPISFVGTHLCHQSNELRTLQAQRLSQLFPAQKGKPVILAGDFNARPGSDPMNVLLNAGWVDAVSPHSVIDYVLIRSCDPWTVKDVIILDEPIASDHDPVLVVLQWQGNN
ncbi:MAG: endonuclease/exonuclease/phosphatase family protein [Phycisphaerae bacterium]|nr:endonuclease/exonuclease/phosphatase family protein [Phycisphaerae bacterium]